ncbi:hypothetical protein HanRHA438_Chr14g0652591 [Helianthus annuus]|nr:hypothetical protein HanRHA438_Chr14g0652591 [Helianthus annuus]
MILQEGTGCSSKSGLVSLSRPMSSSEGSESLSPWISTSPFADSDEKGITSSSEALKL